MIFRQKRIGFYIGMHLLVLLYSLSGFFSKKAAAEPFLSFRYLGYYSGTILILGLFAIGWQQVLKQVPLHIAYANRAAALFWGMLIAMFCFGETITPSMWAGILLVFAGILTVGWAHE